jgi:hypothetical protein
MSCRDNFSWFPSWVRSRALLSKSFLNTTDVAHTLQIPASATLLLQTVWKQKAWICGHRQWHIIHVELRQQLPSNVRGKASTVGGFVFILSLHFVHRNVPAIPSECGHLDCGQNHDASHSICVRTLHSCAFSMTISGEVSFANGARFRTCYSQTLNPSYRLVVQNIEERRPSAVTILRARCLIEWRGICY